MKRLAKLYGMVETLNAMQVRAAAAAVFEVERAESELAERRVQGAVAAREGLARGSRLEALSVEKSSANDEARVSMLAKAGAERRLRLEAAVAAHRESRMEARQVDGLVDRMRAAEELERERRAQGESDDRFLSRREWLRGKGL